MTCRALGRHFSSKRSGHKCRFYAGNFDLCEQTLEKLRSRSYEYKNASLPVLLQVRMFLAQKYQTSVGKVDELMSFIDTEMNNYRMGD